MLHAATIAPPPRNTTARCCCRALLLASIASQALPAAAQTLTIGVASPVSLADPHISDTTSNFALTGHVFETLVARDARLRLQPGLAESWRSNSDNLWEFRLRPGATWHDGKPLTADDVAFTIGRVPLVPGSNSGFSGAVKPITRFEVLDGRTLPFHTAQPQPQPPHDLASVQIISCHAGTGAVAEDYNSGHAASGTGPNRLVSYRPGQGATFARNVAYWGGRPAWEMVDYRFLPNNGARSAAFPAGDVDVTDQVSGNDIARPKRDPRLRVSGSMDNVARAYLLAEAAGTPHPIPHEIAAHTEAQVARPSSGILSFQPLWDLITPQEPDLFD